MEFPENLTAASTQELVRLIEYHNRLYWEKAAPEISDSDYDRLVRELRRRVPDHVLVNAVNAPAVFSGGKVRHVSPMLSLDKAYSLEEVVSWGKKFARSPEEGILVQPKYDGISANFDGRILATRGDGETGEDITDKLPLLELEAPGYRGKLDRPARGEIVIRSDDFAEDDIARRVIDIPETHILQDALAVFHDDFVAFLRLGGDDQMPHRAAVSIAVDGGGDLDLCVARVAAPVLLRYSADLGNGHENAIVRKVHRLRFH